MGERGGGREKNEERKMEKGGERGREGRGKGGRARERERKEERGGRGERGYKDHSQPRKHFCKEERKVDQLFFISWDFSSVPNLQSAIIGTNRRMYCY